MRVCWEEEELSGGKAQQGTWHLMKNMGFRGKPAVCQDKVSRTDATKIERGTNKIKQSGGFMLCVYAH